MPTKIGARQARNNFAHLLGSVHFGKEEVIIERSGKPMVAMIPVDLYEQMIAEREARFQVLERIRQRSPDVAEEEVMQDVTAAVAAVRNAHAARRP